MTSVKSDANKWAVEKLCLGCSWTGYVHTRRQRCPECREPKLKHVWEIRKSQGQQQTK